jgi:ferredoxin
MAFVITEPCISTCDTACVAVCPVDCIHGPIDKEGAGAEVEGMDSVAGMQLYIHPDECIDCGVCEPECPIDAIKADNDENVKDMEKWLLLNKKFSALWPNISKKKEPMENHEKFKNIKNKFDEHFSEKPGK